MAFLNGGGPAPSSINGGPDYSAVGSRLRSMAPIQGPGAYQTQGNSYQAKDVSQTALPQFDVMRQQANQQANQNANQKSDAIQRRYASMGMLNSGAYAAESGVQDQQNAQDKANANIEIGSQQAQTITGLQQEQQQQAFQSGEALAGRNFQGQMQNQSENLQAGEFNNQMQSQNELGLAGMQEQQAESAYNAEMNAYTAKHTGGLLGAGGFLGIGIG